jgi:hypothetical protein
MLLTAFDYEVSQIIKTFYTVPGRGAKIATFKRDYSEFFSLPVLSSRAKGLFSSPTQVGRPATKNSTEKICY